MRARKLSSEPDFAAGRVSGFLVLVVFAAAEGGRAAEARGAGRAPVPTADVRGWREVDGAGLDDGTAVLAEEDESASCFAADAAVGAVRWPGSFTGRVGDFWAGLEVERALRENETLWLQLLKEVWAYLVAVLLLDGLSDV